MKKAAVIALILHMLAANLIYPQAMVVTSVKPGKSMKVRTSTGITYTLKRDPEDFEVGDLVAAIMYTKGTSGVKDDTVIALRYSGFEVLP